MSELLKKVGIDFSFMPCNGNAFDDCADRDRTLSYAFKINIPKEKENIFTSDSKCCYNREVFASKNDKRSYCNDFNGFFHQKQINSELCDFVLIKCNSADEIILNNNDFGKFQEFGTIENKNLKTFVLEWEKVINILGVGVYQVIKRIKIAGVSSVYDYGFFDLKEFNSFEVDKTIRIEARVSGLYEKINVDFSGSGFKTSLRVEGFFGRLDPKTQEDSIVYRNKRATQISIKKENFYKLQTGLIPENLTFEFLDFFILADDIYISDYNSINHIKNIDSMPIMLESNDGIEYFNHSDLAVLNFTFKDRFQNSNKFNY